MDTPLVQNVVSLLMMIIMAIEDIKNKSISVYMMIPFMFFGVIFGIYKFDFMILMSAVPGIFLLFLSYITDEKIGYGDGIITLGLGCYIGAYKMGISMLISMFLLSIFSLVIVCKGYIKKEKLDMKYRIPYIPFLLTGMVISYALG